MFNYAIPLRCCRCCGAACRLVLSWEDLQLDVPGAPGLLVSLLSSRVGLFAARWGFTNTLCGTFLWLSNCMCYSNCAYIFIESYMHYLYQSIYREREIYSKIYTYTVLTAGLLSDAEDKSLFARLPEDLLSRVSCDLPTNLAQRTIQTHLEELRATWHARLVAPKNLQGWVWDFFGGKGP